MPQRRRQPQNNSAAAVRMARHARVQPLRPCPETPWSVCHSCRSSRIHALLCHDIRSQGFMPSVIPAHYGNPFVGAVRRPGSCVASAMTSHLRTPSVSSVRRRPALVEIFAGVGRPELAFAPPPLTKRPLLRQRSCAEPKQLLEPAHMRRAMLSLVFFCLSIGLAGRAAGRRRRHGVDNRYRKGAPAVGGRTMRYTTPAVPSRGRLVRWSRIAALRTQASAAHKQAGQTQEGAMKANGHTT